MRLNSAAFVGEQELIDALERHASRVSCSDERVLFRQGDPPLGLYILRAGAARLVMVSQEGQTLLDVKAEPGALLGLPGVAGNKPYTMAATALKGAELGFVTREDFTAMMLAEPAMSLQVLRVLAAEVQTARLAITEA